VSAGLTLVTNNETASDQFIDVGRYLSNSDNERLHFTAIAKPVPD
jgi:hypothetical protein